MYFGLAGRRALVCAATSGLGLGTARALAAEGAQVVITGRSEEHVARASHEHPSMFGLIHDLVRDDIGALVRDATEAVGELDIVVLNGPGPKPGAAADIGARAVQDAVDSLVKPQVSLVQAVLPGMRARGWGRILALGSSSVVEPIPDLGLSTLGRSALAGYLKTLSREVAADGVTVNLLLPGRIATPRITQLDEATAKKTGIPVTEVAQRSLAAIPAGRYGTPEEFGAVAAFLCSEPAGYVTGTALRCDGGMVASL